MTIASRIGFCTAFAFTALSLGLPTSSRADDADVKAAVEADHAAIHSCSLDKVAAVWSHDADITLVNPLDKTVAVGWDAVKSSWEKAFAVSESIDITQTEGPYVSKVGDVARSIGIAHVVVHLKSKATREVDFVESDVFVQKDGHWLLVSHSAKPL